MKHLLIVLFLPGLFSCSNHRKPPESFPNLLSPDIEWVTYEGILPNGKGHDVLVELQLMPGTPGVDSYYKIHETIYYPQQRNRVSMGAWSQGRYSVLFGSPGQNIIHIDNRQLLRAIMQGPFARADHVAEDLYLKSIGDHELVLVDNGFEEVDARFRLIRRSDLFTVEGYFTVYSDTTEYFERNTRKTWSVARFGDYDEAVKNYYSLAKEAHEGIYLKGLSYSIRRIDKKGNEMDALVFKEILKMDSMKTIQ